jgi:cytochrome c5
VADTNFPEQDRDFMAKALLVLSVLVLLAAVIYLVALLMGKVGKAAAEGPPPIDVALLEERLSPPGSVVAGPKIKGPIIRSAEEIYVQVCADCHDGGALGSPIFGDQAGWTARLSQGMDTLVKHAIEGFNKMPPRGGDPDLSDEDVQKTVQYMVDALQ